MLAIAGTAAAAPLDDAPAAGRPDMGDIERVAQGSAIDISSVERVSQSGSVDISGASIDSQIVIANPGTPTTARDPDNVTGVGQMIIDEQNGFIGLCTGTLINPRTVIFAAHCVNERAANAYGQNSGGQPIGFGFGSNNNVAGASAFGGWLGNYATNTGRYMYDANYVAYNPLTLEPGNGFLYGDVALASLDTPAANVPTWALLFSQLAPTTITANGTGYHVVLDGYGNNGTGTSGSTGGIDYRRRIAENMLGALASLDDFEGFLFGSPNGLNQNLYWIDFDDPRRGTGAASPFDFNAWRDNAVPNEGITASGDSGGPLILDKAFSMKVVIGVLSGGYTRFFNGQPANGYGTASFYQPLYLYWDWIAANNPYHYVSSKAGDGAWTDPNHWVTNLDPNYQIIGPNGQLINGVPTSGGTGTTDQPGFGQACFQSGGVSDCLDIASGVESIQLKPIGTAGSVSNDAGSAATASLSGDGAAAQGAGLVNPVEGASPQAVGSFVLPAATLDNGLPGASNFVPNNYDGDRLTSTKPRYFDVTLSAAGNTTLSTTAVIDRFTINGAGAKLTVASGGSLTSLMNFNHLNGVVQVDGSIRSVGDYLMFAGGLTGSGSITAPYFTNMLGTIAPGTTGTTGTLTFNGNFILTSGSALLIDLGANGVSDKIVVKSTVPPINGIPQNGQASVGGVIAFAPVAGVSLHAGDVYTILTAEGGIGGTFNYSGQFSAILSPKLLYSQNAIQLLIQAGLYRNVISTASPLQVAYAQLLDQNRGQQDKYAGLYGPLDLQNQATIRSVLDSMAPGGPTTIQSLGLAAQQNMANFIQDRLATVDAGNPGGSVALIGNPTQFASLSLSGMPLTTAVASDAVTPVIEEGKLPENMSAFLAGGYLTGNSMPVSVGMTGGNRDSYDGWFAAAGIEASIGDHAMVGLAVSYTDIDGEGAIPGQTATGKLYQGTLYGKLETKGGTLDAQFSAGAFDTTTSRVVPFFGNTYTLEAQDTPLALTGEIGLGKDFDVGSMAITPRAALRYSHLGFTPTIETGGPMALQYDRGELDSLQTRVGARLHGTVGGVRPYLSGNYVHEFNDHPAAFGANFVGGVGPNAIFALGGTDKDWGEFAGGLSFTTGSVDLSIAAETTAWRSDVESQTYRGSLTVHF